MDLGERAAAVRPKVQTMSGSLRGSCCGGGGGGLTGLPTRALRGPASGAFGLESGRVVKSTRSARKRRVKRAGAALSDQLPPSSLPSYEHARAWRPRALTAGPPEPPLSNNSPPHPSGRGVSARTSNRGRFTCLLLA